MRIFPDRICISPPTSHRPIIILYLNAAKVGVRVRGCVCAYTHVLGVMRPKNEAGIKSEKSLQPSPKTAQSKSMQCSRLVQSGG